MKISNAYQLPSESVPIYLDRYTAQRLLLALTQALDPGYGKDYFKKKSKKGKGWGVDTGMKLTKKGYKSASTYGLKLSKETGKYVVPQATPKVVSQSTYAPPLSPKSNVVPPKGSSKGTTWTAEVQNVAEGLVKGVEAFAKNLPKGKSK